MLIPTRRMGGRGQICSAADVYVQHTEALIEKYLHKAYFYLGSFQDRQ